MPEDPSTTVMHEGLKLAGSINAKYIYFTPGNYSVWPGGLNALGERGAKVFRQMMTKIESNEN